MRAQTSIESCLQLEFECTCLESKRSCSLHVSSNKHWILLATRIRVHLSRTEEVFFLACELMLGIEYFLQLEFDSTCLEPKRSYSLYASSNKHRILLATRIWVHMSRTKEAFFHTCELKQSIESCLQLDFESTCVEWKRRTHSHVSTS